MIVSAGKQFENPPEGQHHAVCVDVVDLGWVDVEYKGKTSSMYKIRLVWEIDSAMDDGRPYLASKRYTASLHEKSNLHKDLRTWRGRAFTADELAGFELENVIGVPCQLVIQHDERDGRVYANVIAVLKADPAIKLKPSGGYTRVKDREGYEPPIAKQGGNGTQEPVGEESCPF